MQFEYGIQTALKVVCHQEINYMNINKFHSKKATVSLFLCG